MRKVSLFILTFIFLICVFNSFSQTLVSGTVDRKKEDNTNLGQNNQSTKSNTTQTNIATGTSGLLEERDGVELRYSYTPQKSKACTEYIDKSKYTIHYFKLTVTLYNGSGKTVIIDNAMVHSETDLKTLNHGLPCSDIPARNTAIVFISTKLQPGESKVMYGSDWVRWNQMPTPRYRLDNIYFEKDKVSLQDRKEITQESSNQTAATQLAEWKRKNDQLQNELDNAKNTSIEVFQRAVSEGRKESGALVEGVLAGGAKISDPTGSLVYTGVGLGLALLKSIGEKKAAKKEKMELAYQQELERIQKERRKALIIKVKEDFIEDVLKINKYSSEDAINKKRYASILIFPIHFAETKQDIYFTASIEIPSYADGTYPLKEVIQRKLLSAIKKIEPTGYQVYTLYPITDPENFDEDMIKKMGSGNVIYLDATLLNFNTLPFPMVDTESESVDFWGNPVKKN